MKVDHDPPTVNICMAKIYTTIVICMVMIRSPNKGYAESVMMSVCSGGQLNLTCNTMSDQTILRWNLTFPHHPGYQLRDILTVGSAAPLTVDQTMFQFLRTSVSPLISTMVIDNVSAAFNGTRVECFYGHQVMTTTIINVIGSDTAAPGPIIVSEKEQVRNETITVFLKWTVEENYDEINLIASPQVILNVSNRTSAQLILSYNTLYNVSVTATICGQSLSSSTAELFYFKCNTPLTEENVIANYSYPALEGTNVTFTCSAPSLVFNGSNSSTCMGNGEWEPDPMDVKCISKAILDCGMPVENSNDITITYNFSTAMLRCREGLFPTNVVIARCHDNGTWIPDPADFQCTSSTSSGATIMNSADNTSDSTIVGGTLGALFGILLTFSAIAIIAMVYWIRTRTTRPWSKNDNSIQMHTQELSTINQNLASTESDNSEYSKLQHHLSQPSGTNDVRLSTQGVLYADLGPLSKKVQAPLILNDSHVEYAELNHQSTTKRQKAMDKTLNLDCLLIQLQSKVTQKWYKFGEALGIATEILDRYAGCSPDQSMIEVCDYWFRNHTSRPTWREIANALKKIGFQQLALGVENIYEEGELPVSMEDILEVSFPESEDEPPPPIPPRTPL